MEKIKKIITKGLLVTLTFIYFFSPNLIVQASNLDSNTLLISGGVTVTKQTTIDQIIDQYGEEPKLVTPSAMGGKSYTFYKDNYQDILYKPFKQSNNDYFRVLAKCIVKNISLIGNCLGCENDLRDAINNFVKGKYDIVIDSIYTGDEIVPFLQKSFHSIPRFGKTVYKYDD